MTDASKSKVGIPRLEPSRRSANSSSQSQSAGGRRTTRACDHCRKARAKCTGAQPCKICHENDIDCVYSDRKRELTKKLVGKLAEEKLELAQISQKYADMLRQLSLAEILPQSDRAAITDLLADGIHGQSIDQSVNPGPSASGSTSETRTPAGLESSSITPQIRSRSPESSKGIFEQDQRTGNLFSSLVGPRSEQSERPSDSDTLDQPTLAGSSERRETTISKQRMSGKMMGMSNSSATAFSSEPEIRAMAETQFPIVAWTEITNSRELIEHLVALYFCWEYPTFASLSKGHFLSHFYNGNTKFCSPLLVNAMLALGCRFSELSEARKYPDDPDSAGDHFFEECKRLWGEEEVPTLSTIQAMGLMSLRQASRGNDSSAFFYARQSMRMALDMDLHLDRHVQGLPESHFTPIELKVRKATFWGVFNLEQMWCRCIGRLPQLNRYEILVDKPWIISEEEEEYWIPYTDNGDPMDDDYSQRSNVRTVYKSFSELSEIINDTLFKVNLPKEKLKSANVLSAYTQFLEWYHDLPDHLRLGINFTPAVLFTHIYYHFSVILLFQPFINMTFQGSTVSPQQICLSAAEHMTSLIQTYRRLYTLRRTPSIVPYMLLTCNIALLIADGITHTSSSSSDATSRIGPNSHEHNWLQFFNELSVPHQFARRSVNIVCHFARIWDIPIPDLWALNTTFDGESHFHPQSLLHSDANSTSAVLENSRKRKRASTFVPSPRVAETFFSPRTNLALPLNDPGSTSEAAPSSEPAAPSDVLFSLFPAQGLPFADEAKRLANEGEDTSREGKGQALADQEFKDALKGGGFSSRMV